MIVPNVSFRANPERAIYLDGEIDDQLVSRLTPQILALQIKSRAPITVYILDSPGGSVASMEALMRLLNSSDQDSSYGCNIITVVTSRAASAAADLLASGDYAIAYPGSTVLYHGIRAPLRIATAEQTSMLAHFLRLSNDFYAIQLSRKIEFRFMLRFAILKDSFSEIRAKQEQPEMSDVECFLKAISERLSPNAQKLFSKARSRYGRYEALLSYVTEQCPPAKEGDSSSMVEGERIKAIIDFELRDKKTEADWTFKDGGIAQVADDFFILNEYLEIQSSDRLPEWCKKYGFFALPPSEMEATLAIPDADERNTALIERVRPLLEPVLSFFVAFCHALQEGENELSAIDAYWLGLVDEIMGVQGFAAMRLMSEHQPDPQPALETESSATQSGDEGTTLQTSPASVY